MSFTGIGRIGSQHTLTSPQDNDLYLFNSAMWCTHPLLGGDFLNGDQLLLASESKIVTSNGGTAAFTLLCQDIQTNNAPINKYLAYYNGTTYGILEVDYVIDDNTLILKYPSFEAVVISTASLIDYWNTPILKEVEVRNTIDAGVFGAPLVYANKYSQTTINIWDVPWSYGNEGGVEPMLITNNAVTTILKY